jgi:hypothetical protein
MHRSASRTRNGRKGNTIMLLARAPCDHSSYTACIITSRVAECGAKARRGLGCLVRRQHFDGGAIGQQGRKVQTRRVDLGKRTWGCASMLRLLAHQSGAGPTAAFAFWARHSEKYTVESNCKPIRLNDRSLVAVGTARRKKMREGHG